ncbi:MAG: T9SS type A sorting domain-containing protein [bacterium]|nr:T9SS type A sorting domain-containing protein [bacterium]
MLGTGVASLVNEIQEAGKYSVEFNASNLPSGIYFYTLTSGNFMETKKLILLK